MEVERRASVSSGLLHLAVRPNPSELQQNTDAQPYPGHTEPQSPGWSPASLCFRNTKVILTISPEGKDIAKEKTHEQEGLEAKEEEMTKMMLRFLTGPPERRAGMFGELELTAGVKGQVQQQVGNSPLPRHPETGMLSS